MNVSDSRQHLNQRSRTKTRPASHEPATTNDQLTALKQKPCALDLIGDAKQAFQGRVKSWFQALKPQNEYHAWLVEEVAAISLLIDRSRRIESKLIGRTILRAEVSWDEDRRLDAEVIAESIHKRPSETIAQLKRTPQGCDWLLRRWSLLAKVAKTGTPWNESQRTLAFDLLGTPHLFRECMTPGVEIDCYGHIVFDGLDQLEVTRRQIKRLEADRQAVRPIDQVEQTLAQSDEGPDNDRALRQARRHENALFRRLAWCLNQLKTISPHRSIPPGLKPLSNNPTPKVEPPQPTENPKPTQTQTQPPTQTQPATQSETGNQPEPSTNQPATRIFASNPFLNRFPTAEAIASNRKQRRRDLAEARRDAKRDQQNQIRP